MATKKYNWLTRLIDKITKKDCPNNNSFIYYNHRVELMSGTVDYVDVHISDIDYRNQKGFTFDYWTKELCFTSYDNYDERDAIIKAFKRIYNDGWGHVRIKYDQPWEEERKFYEPMLDNDDYDQVSIMREYNELISRKAA